MSNTTTAAFSVSAWATDFVESRPVRQHNESHVFTVNGKNIQFKCNPNQTSNFDVFCFCHPELDTHAHHTIWNYYRDLFIRAKIKNVELSGFRIDLQNIITEKHNNEPTRDVFSGQVTGTSNRRDEIEQRIIKMCLWLELQYRVDTLVEKLSENITVDDMVAATSSMLTHPTSWPGEPSYFVKLDTPHVVTPVIEDQKVFVKKVFEYTHKNKHCWICESKFGAVKLDLDRYSPFVINFSKQLEQGTVINVLSGKIKSNIDYTVPTLVAIRWFVD